MQSSFKMFLRTSTTPRCNLKRNITPYELHASFNSRGQSATAYASPNVVLRLADAEDVHALAQIDSVTSKWSAGWSPQTYMDQVQSSLSILLVAELPSDAPLPEEQVVGFAAMRVVAGESQLENMAVHPSAQGKGVGKKLLVKLLQESGCTVPDGAECHLEVKANNTAAIALYTALGFQAVGTRKKFYPDGSDALLMTRPAGPLA